MLLTPTGMWARALEHLMEEGALGVLGELFECADSVRRRGHSVAEDGCWEAAHQKRAEPGHLDGGLDLGGRAWGARLGIVTIGHPIIALGFGEPGHGIRRRVGCGGRGGSLHNASSGVAVLPTEVLYSPFSVFGRERNLLDGFMVP